VNSAGGKRVFKKKGPNRIPENSSCQYSYFDGSMARNKLNGNSSKTPAF
jgi:hypothetical protein